MSSRDTREIKRYLSQFIEQRRYIETLETELETLRDGLVPKAISYEGDRVQSSHAMDLTGEIISKIVMMEDVIRLERKEALDLKVEIRRTIHKVEDLKLRSVLTYRYLIGMRWEEIADKMCFGLRHIQRLHGQALNELKEKMK